MLRIHYNGGDKLDGIFSFYQRINKSYFFDVQGTINSPLPGIKGPEIVTKRNIPPDQYWASDKEDEFIIFSFKNLVMLSGYSLANAGSTSMAHSYPEEFAVFGSNNLQEWSLIDERTKQYFCLFSQCDVSQTFYYETNKTMFWKHIKIENRKNSHYSDAYLILRSVELFGTIYPASWFTNTKLIHFRPPIMLLTFCLQK